MDINRIIPLFSLFAHEKDVEEYMPLIYSAIDEVEARLKSPADANNSRLDYLCAAIANLRHTELLYAKFRASLSETGAIMQNLGEDCSVKLAKRIVDEYLLNVSDLLVDNHFCFVQAQVNL